MRALAVVLVTFAILQCFCNDVEKIPEEQQQIPEEKANTQNKEHWRKQKRFIFEAMNAKYDVLRNEFLSRGWIEAKVLTNILPSLISSFD